MAPYDLGLSAELARRKFGDQPTSDQLQEVYQPLLDYAVKPITRAAYASTNNPAQFEKLMVKAAELEPGYYFHLGRFCADRDQEEKAAEYYKKGVWLCRNDVRVANDAGWLVQYYFRKGQISDADKLADRAAEVYSAAGLETKIELLFLENRYSESFQYVLKLEERYNRPGRVIGWCQSCKAKTGDMKYEGEVKKRLGTLFPRGMKKVKLYELTGQPEGGFQFAEENAALQAAQIRKSDVVVAVNGYRIYDTFQYDYVT
jgi:tetratricopeptide (TPR) repeat protein